MQRIWEVLCHLSEVGGFSIHASGTGSTKPDTQAEESPIEVAGQANARSDKREVEAVVLSAALLTRIDSGLISE